jgi:hypothetical protein
LLVLLAEISSGVLGCPVTRCVFAGWEGTAAPVRASLAGEKSAEAVYQRDCCSLGRAEREAEAQDARARGMDV